MLTSKVWRSLGAARQYYLHLQQEEVRAEYYLEHEPGRLLGKLSQRLRVHDLELNEKIFSDLLAGSIGDQALRIRQSEEQRVGYDLTASVPKSISIVYEFTKDPAIKVAMDRANEGMMAAIEGYAQYQQNTATERHYKRSGQILFSSFFHATSRPSRKKIGGKEFISPDMNYHYHNFIYNVTWNAEKRRYQAVALGDGVYRRLPYFEKVFHTQLSFELQKAGYAIQRTVEGGYELAGIDRSAIEKFSNRTLTIDEYAKEHGITDAKAKGELGAKLRLSKKATNVKPEHLEAHWKSRLSKEELETIQNLKGRDFQLPPALSARECLERSITHHLEREAAVPLHKIEATALSYGYGTVLPEDIKQEVKAHEELLHHEINGLDYVTTKNMHRAEERLITLATSGKGRMSPINPRYISKSGFLNKEQERAVRDILGTHDRTLIFRGNAGTGKSRTLITVKDEANRAGLSAYAVTSSTAAAKVLSEQGFEATTISSFLLNSEQQEQLKGHVLIVDESGQCGLPDLTQILELSKQYNFRTVLSGDTRQHSPVTQEALYILEQKAKLKTITLSKIMRQQDDVYRSAIQKLARGRTLEGYNDLDKKLGSIHEISDTDKRIDRLSDDYIASMKKGRKALIISPTHYEGETITEVVRAKLKQNGQIKGKEKDFERLVNLNYTNIQKQDRTSYQPGSVVRFIRNIKGGIQAGSHHEILSSSGEGTGKTQIKDLKTGAKATLPLDAHEHFDVFRKTSLPLAKGDQIRLTQNGKTLEGNKVNNGNIYKVERITKHGLKLDNGKTLPKGFYHIKPGYVETSHGSQGKTADDVFISMTDVSQAAITDQSLYVAASRGKYSCAIYTSSKSDLKRAVMRSGRKISAGEIAEGHASRELQRKQQRAYQQQIKTQSKTPTQEKTRVKSHGASIRSSKPKPPSHGIQR